LIKREFPYIYATWLAPLLSGDNSCEWAVWFKAHFEDYQKLKSKYNFAKWKREHTALLKASRADLQKQGCEVWTEGQNKFALEGTFATLGGKPDLVWTYGDDYVVDDMKSGQQRDSHMPQVQIYMYALPRFFERFRGKRFRGRLIYADGDIVDIPAETIDIGFITELGAVIKRLAADKPAIKVPSANECGFCEITPNDCPERIDEEVLPVKTSDF